MLLCTDEGEGGSGSNYWVGQSHLGSGSSWFSWSQVKLPTFSQLPSCQTGLTNYSYFRRSFLFLSLKLLHGEVNSDSMLEVFLWLCFCYYCLLVLSHVRLFAAPWTVASQAPLSMAFPRQAYWSGLPFPTLRDLPEPGIELASPASPALQVASSLLSHQGITLDGLPQRILPLCLTAKVPLFRTLSTWGWQEGWN